ncbi:hypothetical protein EUTSA_v10022873mg [Eutrema salsugineum]|uniref:Uncharacterized protein n=1 Tax=Eutrema salsugineum TaxID=72664 RepID=V4LKP8_EUTSA|nr:hypothetical protein EUTSA_v10022873mg [Eutrema salsugineum]
MIPSQPLFTKSWYEQTLEEDLPIPDANGEKEMADVEMEAECQRNLSINDQKLMEEDNYDNPDNTLSSTTVEGIGEDEDWLNDDDLYDEEQMDEFLKGDDLLGDDLGDEEKDEPMMDGEIVVEEQPGNQRPTWWRSPDVPAQIPPSEDGAGKTGRNSSRRHRIPKSPANLGISLKKRNLIKG